jgi:hypothetical protein
MAKIQITISAENAQAIAALKQVADVAVQTGATVNDAGSSSGFSELVAQGKQVISVLQQIASVVTGLSGRMDAASHSGAEAMAEIAAAAKKAGSDVKQAGKTGAAGLDTTGTAADGAKKKIQGAGDEGARTGEKIKTGAKKGADALKEAQQNASAFGQTLANVTIIANGVFTILGKFKDAITSAVAPGVEYTKQMESARVGVAGILLSMTKLNGRQLELNEALSISEETFKNLQQKSLQFNLNIRDTSAAFQAIVGPGLAAQMTLEEMTAFAVQGTKAVKSFGLDSMQVVQELRAMVSGDINMDSQVSKAMGITAAGVAEAKQTAGGLFQYLTDKLKGFTLVAGEIPKTIAGKTDMLTAALSLVSEAGFKPLVNSAKNVFDDIIGYLLVTTTKTDEFDKKIKTVEVNPKLVATLNDVSDYLTKTANDVVTFGKAASSFLSPAVPILKFIGNHVVVIAAGFGTWIIAGAVISTIKGVGTAIMVVEGVLKTGAVAWRAYNLAIALGSTNMKAFAISTRVANIGLGAFKITVRGLLASTGIGLLVVGVGMLAEKMLGLADSTDKANDAYLRFKNGQNGPKGMLGFESVPFEAGPDADPGKVSSGDGDPGGKSYGLWQLSSNMGTLQSFIEWIKQEGYQAGNFLEQADDVWDGITYLPGHSIELASAEFDARWKEAAKKFGDSFIEAQQRYIKETHYDPQVRALQGQGVDVTSRSKALQEAVWSTAVQHRNNTTSIVKEAFDKVGGFGDDDTELVKAIYDVRARRIQNDNYLPQDTKNAVIDRYLRPGGELETMLALNTKTGVNTSGLSLVDPAQTAKDLKDAQLKYLQAQRDGLIEQYIAQLEQEEQDVKQKFTVGEIGDDKYFSQIGTILTNKIYAQIENIKAEIKDKTETLTNKNYSAADKKNTEAEIVKLNNDVAAKEAELQKALSANSYEFQQAALQSKDEALDAQIEAYTAQGRMEAAAKLELQKSENAKKLAKLVANKSEAAIKALEVVNADKLIEAQFTEATASISYAVEDMQLAQGNMIQSVVNGTTSVADSVKRFQTDFDAKILADVTKLNAMLVDAKKLGLTARAREIETKLREIKGTVIDYISDLISALDTDLQAKIDAINADSGLTPLQKKDLIEAAERSTAAKKAVAYGMQAEAYNARGDKGDGQMAQRTREQKDLNEETQKYETILQKVEKSARNAFEDGLVEFLSEGITQCATLGEAFRNLANTVLSAIQRVYAEALTKNIMAAMGLGGSSVIPEFTLPTQNVTAIAKRAEGGSLDAGDSGLVRGPGTSTSDSILAYAQRFGNFLKISAGEYVVRGAAVAKYGRTYLDRLNRGLVPTGMLRAYASGGSLANRNIASTEAPGPQALAAELTTGDNIVNLKNINVFDRDEIVGGYMRGRSGERVMLNFVKNNATTVNHILKMRS